MGNLASGKTVKDNSPETKQKEVSYAGIVVGIALLVIGYLMFRSADGDLNGVALKGVIASVLGVAPIVFIIRILKAKMSPTPVIGDKVYVVATGMLSCFVIAIFSSGIAVVVTAVIGLIFGGVLFKFYRDHKSKNSPIPTPSPETPDVGPSKPPQTVVAPHSFEPQPAFQGYPHPGNYYHNSPVMQNAMG
eukprot:TRINITY_DN20424_c0_g1_i1.p1 TRINITY_DN20424_c0_g1~~TRINITY_DN20424_c0_g1_i1.p1  ORF type:complete len:190 (+),score=23.31 TRINITY_DN20424_c0_g1_i1:68-637(+)